MKSVRKLIIFPKALDRMIRIEAGYAGVSVVEFIRQALHKACEDLQRSREEG